MSKMTQSGKNDTLFVAKMTHLINAKKWNSRKSTTYKTKKTGIVIALILKNCWLYPREADHPALSHWFLTPEIAGVTDTVRPAMIKTIVAHMFWVKVEERTGIGLTF